MGLGHLRIPSEPPPLVNARRSSDDDPLWSSRVPTPPPYPDEDSEMVNRPGDSSDVGHNSRHMGAIRDRGEDQDSVPMDVDSWSYKMLSSECRMARIEEITQWDKDRGKYHINIIYLSAAPMGIQRMPTQICFAILSYLTTLSTEVVGHLSCTN
jgi:hypothetical protein